MAEPVVTIEQNAQTDAPNPDMLRLTQAEYDKRLGTPGNYKELMEKYDKGLLEIIPEGEAPAVPVVSDTPATPATTPDEDIAVTLKKSQLGNFASVNEKLKAADEAIALANFLKDEHTKLQAQIATGDQTKAELQALKKDRDDLAEKMATAQTQATTQAKTVEQTVKTEFEAISFDDLDKLDDDQLQEKLYEIGTMKRIISAVKQTPSILKYTKQMEEKAAALEKQLTDTDARFKAMEDKQTQYFSKQDAEAKIAQDRLAVETTFSTIAEFQTRTPDLKTVKPIKDVNREYLDFVQLFSIASGSKSEQENQAELSKFFFDLTPVGDDLRARIGAKGIKPPSDVDKYLKIYEVQNISNNHKVSMDEAWDIYKRRHGVTTPINTASEAARDAAMQASLANRTPVMDSTRVNTGTTDVQAVEDSIILDKIMNTSPKDMKQDPEMVKKVNAYCERNNLKKFDWDKF